MKHSDNNIVLFRKKRDEFFVKSIGLLNRILKKFPVKNGDKHFKIILQYIEDLVNSLENADYYARLSINGNSFEDDDLLINEEAYTDLVNTVYTQSQSIKRMYEHEMKLENFFNSHRNLDDNIVEYVKNITISEHELIYENLRNMKERIDNYNLYFYKPSVKRRRR